MAMKSRPRHRIHIEALRSATWRYCSPIDSRKIANRAFETPHQAQYYGDMTETMPTFDELLEEARIAHGHLCAGQVLGVRLAMLGCARLGIEQPRGRDRKRLVTFVEIDRCATDAIGVVTGCRLGKRALKFRDWGKMAATFVDLEKHRALRIAALESSKARARELYPEIENKNKQQMKAYRELPDGDLFSEEWVSVQ